MPGPILSQTLAQISSRTLSARPMMDSIPFGLVIFSEAAIDSPLTLTACKSHNYWHHWTFFPKQSPRFIAWEISNILWSVLNQMKCIQTKKYSQSNEMCRPVSKLVRKFEIVLLVASDFFLLMRDLSISEVCSWSKEITRTKSSPYPDICTVWGIAFRFLGIQLSWQLRHRIALTFIKHYILGNCNRGLLPSPAA